MTQQQTQYNKTGWGDGPWQDEPDRYEWRFLGFPLLAFRNPNLGHWCGYVGVSPEHPWYGKDYADINVSIHGGLSYSRACEGEICHAQENGESDNIWWLGFDCCHSGDLVPSADVMQIMNLQIANAFCGDFGMYDTYRTLDWVKAEAEKLAQQAVGVCR